MKAKVSKAQLEVWKWKEKAYNQIKDMSLDEGIDFIMQQTRQISDKIRRRSKQRAKARKN